MARNNDTGLFQWGDNKQFWGYRITLVQGTAFGNENTQTRCTLYRLQGVRNVGLLFGKHQ